MARQRRHVGRTHAHPDMRVRVGVQMGRHRRNVGRTNAQPDTGRVRVQMAGHGRHGGVGPLLCNIP